MTWKTYLKPEEAERLDFLTLQKSQGRRERKLIVDRAVARMARAKAKDTSQ